MEMTARTIYSFNTTFTVPDTVLDTDDTTDDKINKNV